MQLIVLLSQAVYCGKIFFPSASMFFPLAMLYGIYFTFLLGYELKEKQYNIFPPGLVFFLLVTEKLVKKMNGERKIVFFSHFHIFPPWTMLYLVPLLRQLRY
jgi:hypothetical protein